MNNLENTGAAVAGLNASIQLGMVNKFLLAAYGLSAYAIGMLGVLAIAIAAGGLIPFGQLAPVTDNVIFAVVINIALTCLFGLQHSVMARKSFKRVFYTLFGEAGERSTFVWGSGVCALTMVYFWQPLNGTIWQAQSLVSQIILWAGFAFGWIYLVAATFAINHWDLFGLRQVWFAITGKPYSAPKFKESWMYKVGRHPIMTGFLIGVWCVPTMTATQLVLAITLTVYIFIGVAFEEKDLIKEFGQTYIDYKKRVGMFFTVCK